MSNVAAGTSPFSQPRRPFRFSLRELMGIVFGLAVGLAAMRQSRVEWYEGLLVSANYWIILGLASQIFDLHLALRRTPNLSADLRTGGRFAIAWRLIVIALLVGYCTLEALRRQGLLTLPEVEGPMIAVGEALRNLLFYLALIMVMSSIPRRAPRQRREAEFYRALKIAGWLPAAALCLSVWTAWPQITFLVHLAISGIENTFPLQYANPDVDLDLMARSRRFAVHACAAAALVPLSMCLTRRLSQAWSLTGRVPWTMIACLTMTLAAAACYIVWLCTIGLPQFSPCFAENPTSAPWSIWLSAGLLLVLASGAASYRLIGLASGTAPSAMLHWRREPRRYYHERGWTVFVLAIALAGKVFTTLRSAWLFDLGGALQFFFIWPENYIIVGAFWLALCGAFRSLRPRCESTAAGQDPLALGRFAGVWLPAFLTFFFAAPLLAWLSFSYWLLVGYRFEWL
jgi:hypothetical protein